MADLLRRRYEEAYPPGPLPSGHWPPPATGRSEVRTHPGWEDELRPPEDRWAAGWPDWGLVRALDPWAWRTPEPTAEEQEEWLRSGQPDTADLPEPDGHDDSEEMGLFDGGDYTVEAPSAQVVPYEGVSEECWRCGDPTVPRRWPQTRMCWPCLHLDYVEHGGVVYHCGTTRSWQPRHFCYAGLCWLPPMEGCRPGVKFHAPPRTLSFPVHMDSSEKDAWREYLTEQAALRGIRWPVKGGPA